MVWVMLVSSLTSLPEDLWFRMRVGRLVSGECEEEMELPALRPRDTGRSVESFCLPKKCQLS